MKPYSLCSLLLLFIAVSQAQIDRSKPPTPGPTPEIRLQEPARFALKNGLNVMVVENHKLPRVSIWLTLDNPPVAEGKRAGISDVTSSILGKGSQSIPKDEFYEEVDFLGATLNVNAEGASAQCLSKHFPRILELMADAALNPNFTQEAFDKEKDKLITGIKAQEKNVSAIAARVQSALAYGEDHPYGEMTTEATVRNITLADVKRHYRSYFVPANAYLVVVGDVVFDTVKEQITQYFTPWTKAVPPSFSYPKLKDVQYTQINFVDVPHAVQSEIAVQHLTDLSMKDEDYLAASLANSILGGGTQARLFKNLREDKGYTYGAYASIQDSKYSPMPFKAYAQVRNAVTDSAVVQILEEIDRMITTPVTKEELATAKAKYAGRFVMALEKPETIANYALNIAIEDLPKTFYKTYLERLEAISVEDVQKAAQNHFSTTKAKIIVTGKGSEVVDKLEQISLNGKKVPVFLYDAYAQKTEKPEDTTSVLEGITVKTVLERYIEAIGGKKRLESVASYAMWAEAETQEMPWELEVKKTRKDQFMQEIKVMGHSVQKQVLNGDTAYIVVQEQHQTLAPEERERIREASAIFPELHYVSSGTASVQGIEVMGTTKAYKLKLTDQKTAFYDVETGLKLQEINSNTIEGQPMNGVFTFDDYREVSGVRFPFTLSQTIGPQSFEFIVKEIKVNEGVTPADFE